MEDNPLRFESSLTHALHLKERKVLDISGVKQIESFDANEFLLETSLGWMMIQGNDLTLDRLDTERGDVKIKGSIEALSYVVHRKEEKEGFMSRLFK